MPVQNFLEQYIDALFEEVGFSDLSPEQRNAYRPQFIVQLERKISNDLVPRLNESQMNEFVRLVDDPNTMGDQWNSFWSKAIPNFEMELKKILASFSEQVKQALS